MVVENVAPDAVVIPNARVAPPLSHASSGRPSPSTSITVTTSAPAGGPSPMGGQPADAVAVGVVPVVGAGVAGGAVDDATGAGESASSSTTSRYTITPTATTSRAASATTQPRRLLGRPCAGSGAPVGGNAVVMGPVYRETPQAARSGRPRGLCGSASVASPEQPRGQHPGDDEDPEAPHDRRDPRVARPGCPAAARAGCP